MTGREMLAEIQTLMAAQAPVSEETRDFLLRNSCLYLLCRTRDPLWLAMAAQNEQVLRDRWEQCAPVFEALEQSGIAYCQLKGAPLGKMAYGSAGMRHTSDMDLLLAKEEVPQAKEVLLANGFSQARLTPEGVKPYTRAEIVYYSMMTHQTAPFLKQTGSRWNPCLSVDLNTGLFWGEWDGQFNGAEFLAGCFPYELFPGCFVRVPEPVSGFISLCLHHYKDMNSIYLLHQRNGYDFSQFCDVYCFFDRQLRGKIAAVGEMARRMDAVPYLYWVVRHTGLLFPDPDLSALEASLETKEGQALLDGFGLAPSERRRWELSFEERVFSPSLGKYLETGFTREDWEKIKKNEEIL